MAMSLGIGIGLPFGGAAAAASGTSASRYSVAGTGFRWHDQSQSNATNRYMSIEFRFGSPAYDITDPRVFCPSFWSPSGGAETYMAGGHSIVIQGWSVEVTSGVWVVCDGASDSGIATVDNSSAGVWLPRVAATLAANTMFRARMTFIVSATSVPIPRNSFPAGSTSPAGQERSAGSTSTLYANLNNNVAHSNGGAVFYKPSMMIAKGGDGREAILVTGDSIGFGANHSGPTATWTSRNEFGFIAVGLDSDSGARRLAYHIMCIPGQRPVGTNGWDVTSNWTGKRAALQGVYDTYGAWPFDRVMNQHIRNSVPYTGSLRTAMSGYFDVLKLYGKPIVQIEGFSSTTSTDGYATTANQTPQTGFDYASVDVGHLWPFNTDVGGADGLGDAAAYFRANGYITDSIAPWRYVAADLTTGRDIYAVRPFNTTLQTAYASGSSIIVNGAITAGMQVYMEQDAGGYGAGRDVNSVTGSGPYTAALNASPGTAAAIGRAVRDAWGDGVHPGPLVHRDVLAASIVDWKAARGM